MILIEDDNHSASRQDVIDYCCVYQNDYNMTFVVAADPAGEVTGEYMRSGTPLNMVLDDEMVIRYREEGYNIDMIRASVEKVLAEE